ELRPAVCIMMAYSAGSDEFVLRGPGRVLLITLVPTATCPETNEPDDGAMDSSSSRGHRMDPSQHARKPCSYGGLRFAQFWSSFRRASRLGRRGAVRGRGRERHRIRREGRPGDTRTMWLRVGDVPAPLAGPVEILKASRAA